MTKHKFLRQRVYHDGLSMIVAKAGESHPVPDDQVADFISDESIHDPDGGEDTQAEPSPYTAVHKGGGRYQITGPGLTDPETVTGKDAMQHRVAELTAALTEGGAGGDGAPTE